MRKYSVFITIVCLGLIGYILFSANPSPDNVRASASGASSSVTYQATAKPTARPTAKPSTARRLITATPTPAAVRSYVLNTNTKKFHKPTCSSVDQMKAKNRRDYTGTRESVIDMGYKPCQRCNP